MPEGKDMKPETEHNPWEEVDIPSLGELSVAEVLRHRASFIAHHQQLKKTGQWSPGWSGEDVKDIILRESNYEQLALRGPAQLAKGERHILAINWDQMEALNIVYDLEFTLAELEGSIYGLIQRVGAEKPVEAEIKYASLKPRTINHLVISEGLARELQAEDEDDIKILEVYQKPEEINLDEL